jgi:hypothetical protein
MIFRDWRVVNDVEVAVDLDKGIIVEEQVAQVTAHTGDDLLGIATGLAVQEDATFIIGEPNVEAGPIIIVAGTAGAILISRPPHVRAAGQGGQDAGVLRRYNHYRSLLLHMQNFM